MNRSLHFFGARQKMNIFMSNKFARELNELRMGSFTHLQLNVEAHNLRHVKGVTFFQVTTFSIYLEFPHCIYIITVYSLSPLMKSW